MTDPNAAAAPEGARLHFNAVLYPNRSLSPAGFWLVMGLVALISFAAGLAFFLIGAWPIVGFYGLDVLLIYAAFRWSYRQARLHEVIRLTDDALEIIRIHPGGRKEQRSFEPYWVRIELDEPADHDSHVYVTSHGKSMVIAAFLTPEERTELAHALRAALDAWRVGAASSVD